MVLLFVATTRAVALADDQIDLASAFDLIKTRWRHFEGGVSYKGRNYRRVLVTVATETDEAGRSRITKINKLSNSRIEGGEISVVLKGTGYDIGKSNGAGGFVHLSRGSIARIAANGSVTSSRSFDPNAEESVVRIPVFAPTYLLNQLLDYPWPSVSRRPADAFSVEVESSSKSEILAKVRRTFAGRDGQKHLLLRRTCFKADADFGWLPAWIELIDETGFLMARHEIKWMVKVIANAKVAIPVEYFVKDFIADPHTGESVPNSESGYVIDTNSFVEAAQKPEAKEFALFDAHESAVVGFPQVASDVQNKARYDLLVIAVFSAAGAFAWALRKRRLANTAR